jgi:hypothetical protein
MSKTLVIWLVTIFNIVILLVLRSIFHGSFWIPIGILAALGMVAFLYMYMQYHKANSRD